MTRLEAHSWKFAVSAAAGAESSALLAGGRERLIRHAGETCTLRQTSKGKLIVTQ